MSKARWLVIFALAVSLIFTVPAQAEPLETGVSPAVLPAFTQISTGALQTCALTSTGGVKCWGGNIIGDLGDGTLLQSSAPVDVIGLTSGVTQIDTFSYHTCAVTSTGGLKCWGGNWNGQLGDGTTTTRDAPIDVVGLTSGVQAVSTGSDHSCAITTNGAVKCWGSNDRGQLGNGGTTASYTPVDVSGLTSGVVSITSGYQHSCALTNTGAVKCWGSNFYGQLGDNSHTNRLTPVDVYNLSSGVRSVSAGMYHTCALTNTGGVKCWGTNIFGLIGDGTSITRLTPVDVTGLTSGVASLSAGESHTCVVTDTNGVKCWGDNRYGELGDGSLVYRLTPVEVSGLSNGIMGVSVGGSHTCALTTAGALKCWGSNTYGQLGDGTIVRRSVPMDVDSLGNSTSALWAGSDITCALSNTGGAKCWGWNYAGGLGDGTLTSRSEPVDVVGLTSGVAALSVGSAHVCALTTGNGVKCWGFNQLGQLGDGTDVDKTTPTDVIGLTSGISAVVAGGAHTCALTNGGGVKCWGFNNSGQLGDGTNTNRNIPVDVAGLSSGVAALAAGDETTCALTVGGGVKCWGSNNSGQLGDGTVISRNTPVDVAGLSSGVSELTLGVYHACVLLIGGGAKCWGGNTSGQLGVGTFENTSTPTNVIGLTSGVVSLKAGFNHTCAITDNGEVKCWGSNFQALLGDGTNVDRSAPVDIPGLSGGVNSIAMGSNHHCALLDNGIVKCWGDDGKGQLGLGNIVQRLVPTDVVDKTPQIMINYPDGAPGSTFTVIGADFPSNSVMTITIGGEVLSKFLRTNVLGQFIFFIETEASDAEGNYPVTVSVNPSAGTAFDLTVSSPLREIEGGGATVTVGVPIKSVFLPLLRR